MEVEIKIDSSYPDPKIIILTSAVTDEVNDIVKKLSEVSPRIITGNRNGKIELLDPEDLIRIYASAGKVFAATDTGEYVLRHRLYELEERLDGSRFVRISNSEIVNLKKVRHFDLSLTGTICVMLTDNTKTYVSRRYVARIKKLLGL